MNPAPNLVLVGPMGAGKSALGRRLAERFGLRFVDLDRAIEIEAGRSIPEIFAERGEPAFRAIERARLAELLADQGLVLATGGGAVLDADNRARMRERGFVVHLHIDVETQLQRLARDRKRPLLAVPDREAVLRRMAEDRAPLYAEVADLRFVSHTGGLGDACGRLSVLLRDRWTIAASTPNVPGACVLTAADLHRSVAVAGDHPYTIAIGPHLLDDGNALASRIRGRHVLIVSDAHVAPLYAQQVEIGLHNARPELRIERLLLAPGEQEKTLANFARALEALAALGATRDACVLALGGGVVGDLAGFAAACWMRGIDCIQLPTTLLAMVDSSVGGKTAVDLPQGKNLVGAFHPPRAVFADTGTLRTLPDRELRAGLAEVVKYGAIADAPFLDWLQDHSRALLAREHGALVDAIARSCRHKAAIVEQDPFERGVRALLNFGHTFGHAIEAEQGYSAAGNDALNHGEAVAVGMVLAARLSAGLGMAAAADTRRLQSLLEAFGLPVRIPQGLEPTRLLERMRLDKKAQASGLRFVLWEAPGVARVVADVPEDAVLEVLHAI